MADDGGDTGECAVCFTLLSSDLQALPCGHVFHADCLMQCLNVGSNNNNRFSCPICRHDFSRERHRAMIPLPQLDIFRTLKQALSLPLLAPRGQPGWPAQHQNADDDSEELGTMLRRWAAIPSKSILLRLQTLRQEIEDLHIQTQAFSGEFTGLDDQLERLRADQQELATSLAKFETGEQEKQVEYDRLERKLDRERARLQPVRRRLEELSLWRAALDACQRILEELEKDTKVKLQNHLLDKQKILAQRLIRNNEAARTDTKPGLLTELPEMPAIFTNANPAAQEGVLAQTENLWLKALLDERERLKASAGAAADRGIVASKSSRRQPQFKVNRGLVFFQSSTLYSPRELEQAHKSHDSLRQSISRAQKDLERCQVDLQRQKERRDAYIRMRAKELQRVQKFKRSLKELTAERSRLLRQLRGQSGLSRMNLDRREDFLSEAEVDVLPPRDRSRSRAPAIISGRVLTPELAKVAAPTAHSLPSSSSFSRVIPSPAKARRPGGSRDSPADSSGSPPSPSRASAFDRLRRMNLEAQLGDEPSQKRLSVVERASAAPTGLGRQLRLETIRRQAAEINQSQSPDGLEPRLAEGWGLSEWPSDSQSSASDVSSADEDENDNESQPTVLVLTGLLSPSPSPSRLQGQLSVIEILSSQSDGDDAEQPGLSPVGLMSRGRRPWKSESDRSSGKRRSAELAEAWGRSPSPPRLERLPKLPRWASSLQAEETLDRERDTIILDDSDSELDF